MRDALKQPEATRERQEVPAQAELFAAPAAMTAVAATAAAETQKPEDQGARDCAINTRRSILVQAPAGAGKTNLLTQRFLALLAEVEEPEQILAITFTRAATAEMRGRIVGALEAAQGPATPGEAEALPLARAALRHAEQRGWRLLEQTHRLNVETIDSLCLRLAHSQPLLARLGGALQPSEDAAALYAAAARSTMAQLGRTQDPALEAALRLLLLRRDNNLAECERLLAKLLEGRMAWLGVLPLAPEPADGDQPAAAESGQTNAAELRDGSRDEARNELRLHMRQKLEQPFVDANVRALAAVQRFFVDGPEIVKELLELAAHAADCRATSATKGLDLACLCGLDALPGTELEALPQWRAIACLLLTEEGLWRRSWDARQGFLPAGSGPGKAQREERKQRIEDCSAHLQAQHGEALLTALCRLRALPEPAYTEEQWATLEAVFQLLRRAVVELRFAFAEANAVDFTEIALAAEHVLADETSMRGLLESETKQHILIDEFQDTSRAQYRLVAALLREWSQGDGRTVFLVGDPLQSIYGFRQAEVALFHETRRHGLPCGQDRRHPCDSLQLSHNFRSHRALVEALNRRFRRIFPEAGRNPAAAELGDTFVAAHAWPLDSIADPFTLHTSFVEAEPAAATEAEPGATGIAQPASGPAGSSLRPATPVSQRRAAETAAVVRVLLEEQPRIAAAEAAGAEAYRVAVLVRSRSHLSGILPALRAAAIPYRALELEPLAEQPEVHDLLMLLRALLHAADRVAWLSVLRAPWCGLTVRDLHLLTGDDDEELARWTVAALIERRFAQQATLSDDGQARLARCWAVLGQALRSRFSDGNILSLASWVERTWMALGGPACVTPTGRDNAEAFLRLLDTLEPSGVAVLRGDFARRLERLCAAPNQAVSERYGVQVMTMHKAKGLGFEVVLLPGLDRQTPEDRNELLAMLERNRPGRERETEILLAPLADREESQQGRNYQWVRQQRSLRDAEEQRRLFYVACTRAKLRLHLFAQLTVRKGGLGEPERRSLLGAAWPALGEEAAAQYEAWRAAGAEARGEGAAEAGDEDRKQAGAREPLTMTANRAEPQSLAGDTARPGTETMPGLVPALAAQADPLPQPGGRTLLRLPSGWAPLPGLPDVATTPLPAPARQLFARSGGSLAARARGNTLHGLLEQLTVLLAREPDTAVLRWREALERTAERVLRAGALPAAAARTAAVELASLALAVAEDSLGRWLLGPHPEALAESSWQGWDADGNLRTLRVDRSFVAGCEPGQEGQDCLWIVDYKTSGRRIEASGRAAWLGEQTEKYRPQVEAYGHALRAAGTHDRPLRCALYFPELLELVSWNGS